MPSEPTCDHYAERHQTARAIMVFIAVMTIIASVWFWPKRAEIWPEPCKVDDQ